ncbi:larval cuticle protein 1-like [Drosophila hydei]|uniref:Larval cuticle protein 1-like n=1 Tax=Drosophila hydei TaxID=7224 RepID=A0A6J1LH10_DROHY|nr:larval cuticle protein 1-like [Drosophila hydei]
MFKFLLICVVIGLAAASPVAPSSDDVHAEVLNRKEDVRADGFDAALETSNHISRTESGDVHGNIQGKFGWISPEGEHIDIAYIADENGYQPKSEWIPTPPPIPEAIQRSLDWLAAHPGAPEH